MNQKTWRIILGVVFTIITSYVTLSLRSKPLPNSPFFTIDGVAVIAHAGGKGLWPDNTLFAMEQATELGVDVLEMDIHATSDGVLVLRHDETVDATTDGTGLIREMSFDELSQLDAAYSWTPNEGVDYPYRGQDIGIPSLEELFTALPTMRMDIEIKQLEPSIAEPLCDLIQAHNMEAKVLVASFHPQSILEFRKACPDVATSAVEPEVRYFYVLNTILLGNIYQPRMEAFQVPEYSGDIQVVRSRFVDGAHKHNVAVYVWTINELFDMEYFIGLDVDGIITDRPDLLLETLGRD